MIGKLLSLGFSSLLGLGLAATFQPTPPDDGPRPPAREKRKEGPGPQDELRKTYDLLRRLRSESRAADAPRSGSATGPSVRPGITGRAEKPTRRATNRPPTNTVPPRTISRERSSCRQRRAVRSNSRPRPAAPTRGYGPRRRPGASGPRPETRLDHIRDQLDKPDESQDARFYNDAARDLYNAARRDASAAGRARAHSPTPPKPSATSTNTSPTPPAAARIHAMRATIDPKQRPSPPPRKRGNDPPPRKRAIGPSPRRRAIGPAMACPLPCESRPSPLYRMLGPGRDSHERDPAGSPAPHPAEPSRPLGGIP